MAVVESAGYEWTISAPESRLAAAQDANHAQDSAAGMKGFLRHLDEAINQEQHGQQGAEEP